VRTWPWWTYFTPSRSRISLSRLAGHWTIRAFPSKKSVGARLTCSNRCASFQGSSAIIDCVDEHSPEPPLPQADPSERRRTLELERWLDCKFGGTGSPRLLLPRTQSSWSGHPTWVEPTVCSVGFHLIANRIRKMYENRAIRSVIDSAGLTWRSRRWQRWRPSGRHCLNSSILGGSPKPVKHRPREEQSVRRLLSSWRSNYQDGVFSMTRARILALSLVATLALSSGALAEGGGGGGGGGGAGGGGAGGASGAAGTTGNSGGSIRGPSGNSVAQPSGGQSSPTGNTAAQPPGSTGQNSINSPGTGVGPGSTPGSTSTRP